MTEARHLRPVTNDPAPARVPPHNTDAERALLGACLLNRTAIDAAAHTITPDDFYTPLNADIWAAIIHLHTNGHPADAVTVADHLTATGWAGTPSDLADLYSAVPSLDAAGRYAQIVADCARRRAIITAAWDIAEHAYTDGDADAVADHADHTIRQATTRRHTRARPIADLVAGAVDRWEQRLDTGGMGASTGLADLDRLTLGLHDGQLITVAARPGMGKSMMALHIAEHAAATRPVLVVSLEMSADDLLDRMASTSGVDPDAFRTGRLTDRDWERVIHRLTGIQQLPITFVDDGTVTVTQIAAEAAQHTPRGGPAPVVIVDYVGLVHHTRQKGDNRNNEVSEISRGLKQLAMRLRTPVVMLSQLSRAVETRGDKRPLLSDLRDSGSLEQDSDVVLFLYRDEVYNPDTRARGVCEVLVAKQRNGPAQRTVRVGCDPRFFRFTNLERTLP